jgi:two-component system, NarL family, response regulator NreC
MSLRVLLADDHQIFREALKVFLEREGFAVVAEARNGREAAQLAYTLRPDIAVLDLMMPVLNGLDAAQEIGKVSERTRPILLTMHTDDHYVIGALAAGVRGYVIKTQAAQDLVQAIRAVQEGMTYLSPGVSRALVDAYLTHQPPGVSPLTGRERQVLQLVAEGRTSKEIADCLGVGVKSIESYRTRIMQKLDIHHTAGLVRYAIREGLIQA